ALNKKNDSSKSIGSLNAYIGAGNSTFLNYDDLSTLNAKSYFDGSIGLSYSYKNFGIVNRIDIDQQYTNDTLYFGSVGKLQNQNIGRIGESYISYQTKNSEFLLGRVNRNFGLINSNSLIFSPNPFSFDQISYTLKNKILRFSTLFARLNDKYGYDIRVSDTIQYDWYKRYLAVHRLEIFPSKNLAIAITESVLFGGQSQHVLFNYLNPANFFYLSKLTDRRGYEEQSANSFISLEFYYRYRNKLSIFSQFLIDDLDFKKELRETYPDRLGWFTKLSYIDLIPQSQFHLTYTRVSNWTYNSFYTWGNYTYYGKSIGFPQHGIERIDVAFDIFKYNPFIYQVSISMEQSRQQNLLTHFVGAKTSFPTGTPEYSITPKLKCTYFPSQYISGNIELGYFFEDNKDHIPGLRSEGLFFYITLKALGLFNLF
ncbi:MAG: hypothetical protein JKY33_04795, partial [Bacteroidia bacterium]|nr:hypothetical protein [Bacteroidia bacterium]